MTAALTKALEIIKNKGYCLAVSHEKSDQILVHVLVGVDLIQHFSNIKTIKCIGGIAWSNPLGIIPFGDINGFLSDDQVTTIFKESSSTYSTLANKCPSTLCNFILDPKNTYEDPLDSFFDQESVFDSMERRLDKFIGCDASADSDSDKLNDYDSLKIKQFKEGIS